MVATVRSRTLAIVCIAVLLISVAAVVGLAALLNVYTRSQVDLAARVLGHLGAQGQSVVIDPDQFAARMSRTATIVFAADRGRRAVWQTSPTELAPAELDRMLGAVAAGGIVDVPLNHQMVKAQLVRFEHPVLITSTATGDLVSADSAVIALGTRSSTKLLWVMVGASVVISVVTMIGAAVAITLVVRRTTRPLSTLTDLVATLGERPPTGAMRRVRQSAGKYRESATLTNAIAALVDRRARTETELRDFIANASHELRTPLTKIQGWSELHFQRPSQIEHTERAMRSIVEECDRMRSLLDQLTLLARVEAPQQLPTEHVEVCALCAVIAEDVAVIAPDRTVTTAIPDEELFVSAHADRLAQVLRNIVSNSLAHGGPAADIQITVEADPDTVRMVLADNGDGIPAGERERVFERFFTSADGGAAGSGLGLAIVHAIVTSYGGSVVLQSEPGCGTQVTVTLPRVGAPPTS